MTAAARSIFVFGLYLLVNGLVLMTKPGLLLGPFGFPEPREPWIRVLGVVVTVLSLYYIQAGRQNVVPFFQWTIGGRGLVLVLLTVLVVTGIAGAPLLVFGVIDILGAVWTWMALRSASRTGA